MDIFKTIEIGTYKNVKALSEALRRPDIQTEAWMDNNLNQIKLNKSKQSLDLVVLSAKELGYPRGALTGSIGEAAKNRGLELCPAEVGPQLRLQYLEQPRGEYLNIAMKLIKDPTGRWTGFSVGRDDKLWLMTHYIEFWEPNNRFVFVLRK